MLAGRRGDFVHSVQDSESHNSVNFQHICWIDGLKKSLRRGERTREASMQSRNFCRCGSECRWRRGALFIGWKVNKDITWSIFIVFSRIRA